MHNNIIVDDINIIYIVTMIYTERALSLLKIYYAASFIISLNAIC